METACLAFGICEFQVKLLLGMVRVFPEKSAYFSSHGKMVSVCFSILKLLFNSPET